MCHIHQKDISSKYYRECSVSRGFRQLDRRGLNHAQIQKYTHTDSLAGQHMLLIKQIYSSHLVVTKLRRAINMKALLCVCGVCSGRVVSDRVS